MPRISVLMTIYNAAPYLAEAVDSLLTQTFGDFELITIENGSSDGSKEIIKRYTDERIKVTNLDNNIGRTPALNLAMEKASGEFIAILDADDFSHPDRFEKQIQFMENNPATVLLASWFLMIDQDGKPLGEHTLPTGHQELINRLAYDNPFGHSTCFFSRQAAMEVGGYPDAYVHSQDFALCISLASKGNVAILPESLVSIRFNEATATNRPEYQLPKFYDAFRLHKMARSLPGLSDTAKKRNKEEMARAAGNYGKTLIQRGRLLTGCFWLARSFLLAPMLFVSKAVNVGSFSTG